MSHSFDDSDLRLFLGNLLRYGVLLALGIVVLGLMLFLFQSGHTDTYYASFIKKDFDFSAFFKGLWQGNSFSIMACGVILLILTPVLRVIFAIIGFFMERDLLYTAISVIVLIIIIISTILGAATA